MLSPAWRTRENQADRCPSKRGLRLPRPVLRRIGASISPTLQLICAHTHAGLYEMNAVYQFDRYENVSENERHHLHCKKTPSNREEPARGEANFVF